MDSDEGPYRRVAATNQPSLPMEMEGLRGGVERGRAEQGAESSFIRASGTSLSGQSDTRLITPLAAASSLDHVPLKGLECHDGTDVGSGMSTPGSDRAGVSSFQSPTRGTDKIGVPSVRSATPGSDKPGVPSVRSATPGSDKAGVLSVRSAIPGSERAGVPSIRSVTPGSDRAGVFSVRSANSGSDTKSYRERIRDRVQAAKERALAVTTLKQKITKPVESSANSKSINLDKEEDEVEEAMKRHEEARSRWKVAAASLQVASVERSYEFFNKEWVWEDAPRMGAERTPPISAKEETSEDGEQLLAAEVVGGEDWQPLVTHPLPHLTNWDLLKHKQIGLLFCPSTSPVPIEEKVEGEKAPRFVEEEGLYVDRRRGRSWKTRNKLEQRIMAMGSERFWFGEDGELKGLQDPLQYSSFNISLGDKSSAQSQVLFVPAKKEKLKSEMCWSGTDTYLLEVEVGEVRFGQHPLFSAEDRLGERLGRLCRGLAEGPSKTGGRLQALRISRDHCLNLYPTSRDPAHLLRANRYKTEIKEVRTAWLWEKRKERESLAAVLETWRDLKALRERQGFISSRHRLRIVTSDQDPSLWNYHFRAYLEEAWEEAQDEYKKKMKEYEERLEKWNRRMQMEATKQEGEASSSNDIESTIEKEEKVGEELAKPKKPKRSKLEGRIKEELVGCLGPEGEPRVEVQLLESAPLTPTTEDKLEEARRKAVCDCSLSAALQVDGRLVDRTCGAPVTPHFTAFIAHRFSLKISSPPTTLAVQLTEVVNPNLFGKKPIAQIFIPIPGRVNTESAQWSQFEFCCPGPPAPRDLSLSSPGPVFTEGVLSVRAGWGHPLPFIIPHQNRRATSGRGREAEVERLKQWMEQVRTDPNDPSNADLFDYIKRAERRSATLKEEGQGLELCREEELAANPRLRVLMLREARQPEFRALRKVPIDDREIPNQLFKMYEKRMKERQKRPSGDRGSGSIDQERAWARQYLEQIREEVMKRCSLTQGRTFTDMVHEEPVPDLGTLGLTVMKWLQPKRPLRPKRKERKKMPANSLVGHQLEIIVNIGRAFEVPVRKDVAEGEEAEYSVVPVRPYIEVTFQGERRRTTTAEGANPTWNQDLHIPIQSPDGEWSVQSVQECIHMHLYDERLVDMEEEDAQRIHQRLEKHWLASLTIPFTALFTNSRIEGTLQMYSPPVLLGYQRESTEFRDSTFLTVFLTVHPPLHPPSSLQEKLEMESGEEVYLEQHLEQWRAEVRRLFPHRHVPTLVLDTSGKSVCITRFFREIPPPELAVDMKTTPEMAARFVSMISLNPSNILLHPGHLDIWLTAQQVLSLGVSEGCSSAALLACFLRHLGHSSWLLVGSGLSSGPAPYVLSKFQGVFTIWDPASGRSYPPSHPFSPIYRVYCLVDETNIWVNNQKEELVGSVGLEVTRRGDWWPAFGRNLAAPLGSIQPASLVYRPSQDVGPLEGRLEKILRNAIMKLRPNYRTIWNRYCSSSLKKLLPGLERAAWSPQTEPSSAHHLHQLQHILASYKMCGFPVNMPYTSPGDLVQAVTSTGVHLNEAPDIEFSIAVYLHPFPNNILSVWVYVASLVRRR